MEGQKLFLQTSEIWMLVKCSMNIYRVQLLPWQIDSNTQKPPLVNCSKVDVTGWMEFLEAWGHELIFFFFLVRWFDNFLFIWSASINISWSWRDSVCELYLAFTLEGLRNPQRLVTLEVRQTGKGSRKKKKSPKKEKAKHICIPWSPARDAPRLHA